MPASAPPTVLIDNVYDRVNQYPTAVLSPNIGSAPNRPPSKVADYRRERTYWQGSTVAANHGVISDLGVGVTVTGLDTIFIDRGHNLWNKNVVTEGSSDGIAWTHNSGTATLVPALDAAGNFVPGGDPTVGWAVTEEGAIYKFFAAAWPAKRIFRTYSPDVWQPIFTGIILGKRLPLTSYSRTLDEDAGGRKRNTDESEAGYVAASRVYAWREGMLDLGVIGATEYDAAVRLMRRSLFEKNTPAFVAWNYGRWPERAWVYTLNADRWSFPTNGVHRAGSVPLRELYPVIR